MSTLPYWKKIHQTVSGYSQNTTNEIVAEVLSASSKDLLNGLFIYESYTKKSYDEWSTKCDVNTDLKELVHDLSQDLNLEASTGYSLLCNYLIYEYYGKLKEFSQITRIGTTVQLRECIQNFYTSERMFLLKTWRHIFEFLDKNEKFSTEYKDFVKSISLEELQGNLIKRLEGLYNELTSKQFHKKNPCVEDLLCRTLREQIECTLILILTLKEEKLSNTNLSNLVQLFIQSNFSTTPPLYELKEFTNKRDLHELMFAEICCFFVIFEDNWDRDLSHFLQDPVTKEIDNLLLGLHLNPGHTLVLLAWSLLRFKTLQNASDSDRLLELFNAEPFVLLQCILSSDIFKNNRVGDIVFKATHRVLDELSVMYEDRKLLYEARGMINVLAEFLKHPELCDICMQNRNGLDSLLEIAIETFPLDFMSFTLISKSLLTQPKQYKQTIDMLNSIPSFLSEVTWPRSNEKISALRKSQRAIPESDLIIFPATTLVRSYGIFGTYFLQYKGKYSYFVYLEYLVNLLINSGVAQRKFNDLLVEKVIVGFSVVIEAIKNCADMDLQIIGVERVVLKLNKLLIHLDGLLLHYDLIKLYFDVLNTIITYRKTIFFTLCSDIVWKVFFPKLRPEYIGRNIEKLLFNEYIFEDTIFTKFFQEEEFKDDHSLLLIYINILDNLINLKVHHNTFQLSGVAYLFNFVFLRHQSWIYKNENQRTLITMGCLRIFHNILQKNEEELKDPENKIYSLCLHAFLNNVYVIESFFRLFVKEKHYLVFTMERETNWIGGPSLDRLTCIKMQLALLLIIMQHKKALQKCSFEERLPYVVKPVASYFTNSYSPVIAELSCRFLAKLAEDRNIPLLALLEFDHYQVQSLFLEKLRDPLEEEKVKIAIIDLINTCISHQNGMTAAFFNLKCFMYWDGISNEEFKGDSVSDFMVDYLDELKKSPSHFHSPLHLGVLRLLFNLWMNHREKLINNLSRIKNIWDALTEPFFLEYGSNPELYTAILRIMNVELGNEKIDENLQLTVDKFLKDKTRLEETIKFVLILSEENTKINLEFLTAWIEFLVLARKTVPNSFTNDVKITLINSCVDGVNIRSGGFTNIEVVYLWSELYFILTSTWGIPGSQRSYVIEKLYTFLHSVNAYYKYLTPKIKEIFLCCINQTLINLKGHFNSNTGSLLRFLSLLAPLIDAEFEFVMTEVWSSKDDSETSKKVKPWLIIIFIGTSILELEINAEIGLWFTYQNFLKRVVDSVGAMLQTRRTLPFAKLALDFLITYAESSLTEDFLKVDLFSFYYQVKPPSVTITLKDALMNGIPFDLKEWWLIFITLIKLNRILLHKLRSRMLAACFTFISQQDILLNEIISLSKSTVDMTALALVCETLKLVYILLDHLPNWNVQSPNSYELIMNGIKTSLNACVLSVLGYKKINFYKILDKNKMELISSPTPELTVSVLNKVTEIIYWSLICLKKTKPNVITQPESYYCRDNVPPLVEIDFNVPRFEIPITPKLTYGALLCLADYLCRTLNQLSPETPVPTPRNRQVRLTDLDDEIKVKSLSQILEHCMATYETCIGFMLFLQKTDDLPNEKLSSFLHYDMSDFSGTSSSSIISQLDYHIVKNALEALMMFLAYEIFFTMKSLNEEALFAYKRELSSEIQFFYEFVRKRTTEQFNAMASTPRSSLSKNEFDIIKRYTMSKVNSGCINDIAETNFVLVISHWLIKCCHLSN